MEAKGRNSCRAGSVGVRLPVVSENDRPDEVPVADLVVDVRDFEVRLPGGGCGDAKGTSTRA